MQVTPRAKSDSGSQPTYGNVCLVVASKSKADIGRFVEKTIFLLSPDRIWFNG